MRKTQTNIVAITLFFLCFVTINISLAQKKSPLADKAKKSKLVEENLDKKIAIKDTILQTAYDNDSIRSVGKMTLKLLHRGAKASYYADKFSGRLTASGTRFSNNDYTCAHKKLPFGTRLKVTSERTKKSIIVVVTDRGPFVRGREVDLSKRSFIDIAGKTGSGVIVVTIEMVKR
ncbi:MAG: hypothetical protein RLZZ312_1969 [Bacteroidota bacterium]|jgi:rare lipoprotein A